VRNPDFKTFSSLIKSNCIMSVKITDHYFEYNSQKYFRGNAHLLEIGTYGEKKNPLGSNSYLDPQNKVKREHMVNRVTKGLTAGINWNEASQKDVEVNGQVKVFGIGVSTAVGYTFSKVKSAKLKLYNLFINEGPLKAMLNGDASGARKYLADEGNDGRILSEVWVLMEGTLAEHFDTSTTIAAAVSVSGINLDITAKGGKSGSQTITLSAGTIFAYKMHKVKDWNKEKTQIEDMEADYYGMA
jgi:hypothetical protein